MLPGVAVRTPGPAGQGLQGIVVAGTPEVDVGPAFVALPADTAYTVLPGIGERRQAVFHVLGDTVHEACASSLLGVATQRYRMGAQVSSFFSSLSDMDWSVATHDFVYPWDA